jgi:hypothetical protein
VKNPNNKYKKTPELSEETLAKSKLLKDLGNIDDKESLKILRGQEVIKTDDGKIQLIIRPGKKNKKDHNSFLNKTKKRGNFGKIVSERYSSEGLNLLKVSVGVEKIVEELSSKTLEGTLNSMAPNLQDDINKKMRPIREVMEKYYEYIK